MQKIACIFSFKMSSWVSCQKIVFNLHKAYERNKDIEISNFNYSSEQTPVEIINSAKAIVASKPDTIVILDHKPHPLTILQLVLALIEGKKPRIIFHIFGDFTLYYSHWDKLNRLIKDREIEFLVASDRQKLLIDKFLPENLKSHVCPFPVDKKEFFYNPALRPLQRKEWGLTDGDMAYVYTGRLSRQKRIHTLLKGFSDFLENTKATNAHLFIYGMTDSVGDRFIGKWEVEGEYFRKLIRTYNKLAPEVKSKIHFMGNVPNLELKSVYQGADMLVNLSVHNDEDFGMSVAEAQCSGLPAILTDWGGLASFYHEDLPEATTYIPARIGDRSKLIRYKSVVSSLMTSYKKGHFKNRELLSQKSLNKFGVDAVSTTIKSILNKKSDSFSSFTPFFDKVIVKYVFSPNNIYVTEQKNINALFREIYSSYVRNP